jgi:gamma-aminobutyric acid type B receptor
LSDRREFPLFYRTVAPDSSHNPARIAFIRRFGWDTVTTFSQNEEIHSLAVNDLVTELERANISCAATITFAETDFKDQLKMLRVSLSCHVHQNVENTLSFRRNSFFFLEYIP